MAGIHDIYLSACQHLLPAQILHVVKHFLYMYQHDSLHYMPSPLMSACTNYKVSLCLLTLTSRIPQLLRNCMSACTRAIICYCENANLKFWF